MTKDLIAQRLDAELRERIDLRGGRCFALIDGALARKAFAGLGKLAPLQSIVPEGGAVSRSDLSALPFLLDLSALQGNQRVRCISDLVQLAQEHCAATWMASVLAPAVLASELALRMDAELPGDLSVLLRFADARVLPVLHDALEPAQRASFFGCTSGWWYLNRRGELLELALPNLDSTAPEFRPPIRLTASQEQRLLDAAEPDAVLQLLRQHDALSLDRIAAAEHYYFASQCIGRAKYWSLQTPTDLMLFCMVALDQGSAFDEQARWADALRDVRAGKLGWAKAIQQVVQ